ncbi:hypothetical protein IU505_28685 [Nocardia nova]|nr:hypothetical protein [Nocardia nova]
MELRGPALTLKAHALDLGYAVGWQWVRTLPQQWALGLFGLAADRATRDGGPVQLRRNLARVLVTTPSQVPDDLVHASMRSYARYCM